MALGVLIPAVAAGLLAFALIPRADRTAPGAAGLDSGQVPARLARMAATSPLHPIVLRGGRAELGRGASGLATTENRPAVPARITIPDLDVHADVQRVSYGGADPAKGNPWNIQFGLTDGGPSIKTNFTKHGFDFGIVGRAEYKVMGDWRDYNDFTAKDTRKDLLVIGGGATGARRAMETY